MNIIRRLSLAVLLALSLSPAFGQVAPPVPALPDAERRTSYSISASTCSCAVGFQLYGDSTDYANWIEVFVNGVRMAQAGNWTLSSATGTIGSIPLPITNAVLTFTAPQTGTIQIVGARRPRRTSQFNEGSGVPTRNFNVVLSDLTAQNRELWDKTNDVTGRALLSQPGVTLNLLPLPSVCAGKFLGFDATGLIPQCSAGGAGSGNVVGPASSVVGHFAFFNNTTGTLLSDGGAPAASATTDTTNASNISSGTLAAAREPPGVPTNTRSAYSSVNSLATTDCGKTVALGGSAFYAFTVGAASGFNAACQVIIANEDSNCPALGAATCRGKAIAINGYTAFILWPGQQFNLVNQNNVWQYEQPGRWVVQALPQFNVNHASGLNPLATTPLTDCLGSGTGACNTIQNAVLVVESYIDCNNFGPTIKNVNETFTENNVSHTHPLTGYHVFSLTGDTTTPGNVVWQVSGTGNIGFQGRDTGMAIITGFKFVSTGTGNLFIQSGQLGITDFGSIDFGANSGGYDIYLTRGGAANFFGGTLAITGDMAGFVFMESEGHVLLDGATISIPNARTWNAFFTLNGNAGVSATSMVFTGAGAGAGSTGRQWIIDRAANLSVTSSTIPGSLPGLYNCTPIASVFTSGTNAALAPSTCNGLLPVVLEFELQGGGGGGAGSGTTPGAATAGNPSCLSLSGTACSSPVYQAGGGLAGTTTAGTIIAGGTVSGSGTCDDALPGGAAGAPSNQVNTMGTMGGVSPYGGAGGNGFATAGGNAAANSGSGGGGAGTSGVASAGGGGSAGATCKKLIANPVAAYVYTIGAAANGGTAGTSGFAGGNGAAGRLKVVQRW